MIFHLHEKNLLSLKFISTMSKTVFLIILFSFFYNQAFCENLDHEILIYEDSSKILNIDQVLSLEIQQEFKKIESIPLNIGYSNSIFWVRINVNNKYDNLNLVLDPGWAYYNVLEFYYPSSELKNEYKKFISSFSSANAEMRYFPINQDGKGVYYLRMGSDRMLSVSLHLRNIEGFIQSNSFTSIAFGITLGVTLAMLIYNLMIYYILRDRAYLYYGLFQFASFVYFLTKQWSPLNIPHTGLITLIFANLAGIGFCYFLISVLDLDKNHKFLNKIMVILSIIIAFNVTFGLILLPFQKFSMVTGLVNLAAFATGIILSLVLTLKKNKLARIIFFSWVFSASVFAIYIFENMGLLPKVGVLYVNFSVASEAILMSFVLAYRIKLLKQDYANAELVAEAKSTFLASMSHEIRTPITAILGYAGIIMKRDLPEELKRYLNNVIISANHLVSIINDIIDMAKIEAGKIAIENITFNLDELIRKVMRICAHNACARGNELVFLSDPDLPIEFSGDPLRIEQILLNLISNASKFTSNGDICVRVYKVNDNSKLSQIDDSIFTLAISVSDTGIGIPKDRHASIFQTFEQADASTTRNFGGSGLGLSISRQLARLMGGDLTFESEVNSGSVFKLELPFAEVVRESEQRKLPSRLPENSSVLVVDDNLLASEALSGMLRRLRLSPCVASSGASAIEMIHQDPAKYSLLIVDQEMPILDGIETIEALFDNGLPIGTPIMLTTTVAKLNEENVSQIRNTTIFNLQKPVSIISLQSTLFSIFDDGQLESDDKNEGDLNYELLNNKNVLVVDDNQFNREVLDVILSQCKINVTSASSGHEAIGILKNNSNFDVILMDVEMPNLDGLSTTKIIRKELNLTDLPILALTAKVIKSDRDRCIESGMNDYLSKPIDTQVLFNKLIFWIEKR